MLIVGLLIYLNPRMIILPKTIDIPCGYGPDKFAETDRECIEEDYSPGFTPCVNGRQAQFQQKLTDCITPCLNYPANVLKRLQTCVQLDAEDPNDNGPIEGCEPLICQKDRQAMRWFHYDCKDLNEYNSLVFYDSPFLVVDIQCELKVEEGKVGFTSMTDAIEAGVEVNIIKDLGVHFAVENVLAKTKVVNRGANSIWTWGNNAYGQLGFPPKVTKDLVNDQLGGIFVANIEKSPKRLPAMDQILFQSACAGETHSCVVTDSGDLYCMGSNYHGQHGQNDFVSRGWPALVTPIQKIGKVKSIACGPQDFRINNILILLIFSINNKKGKVDSVRLRIFVCYPRRWDWILHGSQSVWPASPRRHQASSSAHGHRISETCREGSNCTSSTTVCASSCRR